MKKTFILDTNVLLSDKNALLSFEDNDLVLPLLVLEELDHHKDRQDEVGFCARENIRIFTELTKNIDSLKKGVGRGNGLGTLKVISSEDYAGYEEIPEELSLQKNDNELIRFYRTYSSVNPTETVIFVTRDLLLRLKCKALNIPCEDYKKFNIVESINQLYSGVTTVTWDHFDFDGFYGDLQVLVKPEWFGKTPIYQNQFLVINNSADTKSALAKFISFDKPLKKIPNKVSVGKIEARNKEQKFALDLLFDPEVKIVILSGKAGSGKTLLSLAAGLEQTIGQFSGRYSTLAVCRPVQTVGKDIGYLPGDASEKQAPWMAPIKDNLRFLMGNGKKTKQGEDTLQYLFDNGTIEIEIMAYIRGRSIANAFLIIEECQNLNLHELKSIVTRVGEGTKIILNGDIQQIDVPYLDSISNGLSIAIEKFKGSSIAGSMTLIKGERSEVATLAAKLL